MYSKQELIKSIESMDKYINNTMIPYERTLIEIKKLDEQPTSSTSMPSEGCEWSQDGEDSSTWSCNKCSAVWELIEGNPFFNGMRYCPNCGKEIKLVRVFVWDNNEIVEREITLADYLKQKERYVASE